MNLSRQDPTEKVADNCPTATEVTQEYAIHIHKDVHRVTLKTHTS